MTAPTPDPADEPRPPAPSRPGSTAPGHRSWARPALVAILAALFAAMLGYQVLHAGGLQQTALFYIGLPATIALVVAATARPRTVTGMAVAAVTIGLALAGPLLGEGVVCLVMAAPLFFLVAIVIGLAFDLLARSARSKRSHAFGFVPVLALLCLEGVVGSPVPPNEVVTVTRTVQVSAEQFSAALAGTPRFTQPRSSFLSRVPFPRVVEVAGTGLDLGDERVVTFTPRRSLGIGAQPTPRSMRLRITQSGPAQLQFDVVQDTATARWLRWQTSQVSWRATSTGVTEVTWRLGYQRTFDPGWYFGPLQRYGMQQATGYLLDTFTG
jgi:hypothetical protein